MMADEFTSTVVKFCSIFKLNAKFNSNIPRNTRQICYLLSLRST